MEEIACMDDDLLSLLDWPHCYGDTSIDQLTNGIRANMDHASPPIATTVTATNTTAVAVTTSPSLKQDMESFEWYTMPTIC